MLWYQCIFGNMPVRNMSERKLAKYETDREFVNTFNRLFNMALNTFSWEGLPETCNERFLELSLMLYGSALLCDKDGAFVNLASADGGEINIYGEPLTAYGYGLNGWNHKYNLYIDGMEESPVVLDGISREGSKQYNAVLCRDNKISYPYVNYIFMAAQRLTRAMRTMDVVCQNLKQPVIITCEESMVKTVRETLNQRGDNVNAIISSGKLPIDSFKVWDTKANPQTLSTMWEHYDSVEAHLKELFGVNSNSQADKRERLIVDEVNANNEATEQSVEHRLKERQLFCERVNKAFGLNISVQLNVALPHGEEDLEDGEEEEEIVDNE